MTVDLLSFDHLPSSQDKTEHPREINDTVAKEGELLLDFMMDPEPMMSFSAMNITATSSVSKLGMNENPLACLVNTDLNVALYHKNNDVNNVMKTNMLLDLDDFHDKQNVPTLEKLSIDKKNKTEELLNFESIPISHRQHSSIKETLYKGFEPSSPLEKSNSLSHLPQFDVTRRLNSKSAQRAVSFHEDTLKDKSTLEALTSLQKTAKLEDIKGTAISMDELERSTISPSPVKLINKQFANDVFRKAVSLCELQNIKFKENFAKLEQKFLSTDSLTHPDEDDSETWFPRLSYEDCSSCASCKSRSSSYHSLLYDMETATNYQIYQPTVCDVVTDDVSRDNDDTIVGDTNRIVDLKSKRDRLIKQSSSAFGSLKDKLKRSKASH